MTKTLVEWRPVVGYENDYEVSNYGDVRSLDRWRRNRQSPFFIKGRPVTQHALHKNHRCVYLYREGRKRHKRWLVHRLVLFAFVGDCPDSHECCHRDGDPTNNHVSNLYWGTRKQNQQDRIRHGRHNNSKTRCKRGHEFTPENTIDKGGARGCRQCVRIRKRLREERRNQVAA